MSFTSQHISTSIDKALSAVMGVTTGSNPSTLITTMTSTDTMAVWRGGAPQHIAWSNILLEIQADLIFTAINIDGGAIDGTPIGATTPSTGAFTTLSSSGGITGTLSTATQNSVTTMTGLTTVGTIATGVWQGTAVQGAH